MSNVRDAKAMTWSRSKNLFIRYALINLIPFEILSLLCGLSAIVRILSEGFSVETLYVLFTPIIILVPLLVLLIPMVVCYGLFRLSKSVIIRALTLYIFWALSVFLLLYTVLAGIGGVSMAYQDGGLTSQSLHQQAAVAALKVLGLAHLIILPWIYAAFRLMKRFIPDL